MAHFGALLFRSSFQVLNGRDIRIRSTDDRCSGTCSTGHQPRNKGSPARLGAKRESYENENAVLPVFSVRHIETPYERRHGYKNYLAVVDARFLPDLSAWREINVRDAKTRGRVPNAIRRSFDEKGDEFLFMNRGLVVAAEKVEFKEGPGEKHLDLIMVDPEIHGLLDGGHTYRVVTESAEALSSSDPARFVRMEIITGFDRETISDGGRTRQTRFEMSLSQIYGRNLSQSKRSYGPTGILLSAIAWSEYEELETGKPKPIDVRDIISYLITFDTGAFNSTTQPLIAYKDKRACLRHFQQNKERIPQTVSAGSRHSASLG